ncbi:Hemerythrin HHE cation binding domain-containing protein [Micromonospora rhizosphaerae]|uniref:Hemerythrin HHE cation binding domain-containing protein n=1 Tax=Micromonospora rhizosphaerae TaxID=568872 RepID=A0A1C6SWQ3_9ACTN|nr:hemerythrin domain-containing protein [Micromonospora rhizosphaerae]SCL34024.1 Hemerythrin HHE cation binding domain-containing protein [Micromonospora rhizosphaerae]
MDAVELLEHDHRVVEQLFRDYHAAASDAQRRAVVEILVRELSKHAALEELLFYPFAAKVLDDGQVEGHLAGHAPIKELLLDLDRCGAGDPAQNDLMERLASAVARHVRNDEDQLMPCLRQQADEQALRELGHEIDQGKQRAPTRPHPHAPDKPPALALAAPVAAIYDRLRDRMEGRPRT